MRAIYTSMSLLLVAALTGHAQTVTNNTSPLTLGTGAPTNLLIVPGSLTAGGILNNTSTITINPKGTLQLGRFGTAPVLISISGGGSITLAGGSLVGVNRIVQTLQGPQLVGQTGVTNVDNTISGWGSIRNMGLTNQGIINANSPGETLRLSPATLTNSGQLQAGLGGTLAIGGTTNQLNLQNNPGPGGVGGTLLSNQGGTITLDNVSVSGGFLDTLGSGVINGIGPVTLGNLAVNGTYNVGARTTTTVTGAVRNNGAINVPAAATLNGSRLISGNKVTVARGGMVALAGFDQTGGTLLADGSITTPFADIEGGVITGTGTLTGTLAMAGTYQPGDNSAPGIFSVIGQYNQAPSGILDELLGGNTPGAFSQTLITGPSTLAGLLDVSLYAGFQPGFSDVFPIMLSTSGFSGYFADAMPSGPGLPGLLSYSGGTFDVNYNVSWDGELAVTLSNFTASPATNTDPAPTPEPPSFLLLGTALIAVSLITRGAGWNPARRLITCACHRDVDKSGQFEPILLH